MDFTKYEHRSELYEEYFYKHDDEGNRLLDKNNQPVRVTTVDEFVAASAKDRPNVDDLSAELINQRIAQKMDRRAYGGLGKFTEFSPEERANRKKLSIDLQKKYDTLVALHHFTEKPTDTKRLRYPQELMMKTGNSPDVAEYNKTLYEAVSKPNTPDKIKESIRYHHELLKKYESYKPDELATQPMDDAKLVENFEKINFCLKMGLQIQNIRDYFKNNNIVPPEGDQETADMLNECETIMKRYEPAVSGINLLSNRLNFIQNPIYEVIDPDSETLLKISQYHQIDRLIDFDTLLGDDEVEREDGSSLFEEYIADRTNMQSYGPDADLRTVEKLLQEDGAAPEDIQYRVISQGKVSEVKPYLIKDAVRDVTITPDARVEVFSKNAPDKKYTVHSASTGELYKEVVFHEQKAILKPKRPNAAKRLLHWISNSNYKKEFDDYYKQKAIYDIHTARRNKQEAIRDEADAHAARERLIEKKNADIMKKLTALPHRTQADIKFHNTVSEIIHETKHPDSVDKVRNFLLQIDETGINNLWKNATTNKNFHLKEALYKAVKEEKALENDAPSSTAQTLNNQPVSDSKPEGPVGPFSIN